MSGGAADTNPATAEGLWAKPHRAPTVSVLTLMTFIAYETYAIITALPVVAADLQADGWYSFAFASTVATGLVGMVIGGNWADRSGVRTPLAIGGALFLVGLFLCAVAPRIDVFIAGRLLQGLGGGIDSVVVYVVIAQLIPERLRPRMFGLLVTAWLLPAIVGPLVTGALVDGLHWRGVFALILVGSAISISTLIRVARHASAHQTNMPIVGKRGMWAAVACLGFVGLHLVGHRPPMQMLAGTALAVALVGLATHQLLPTGTLAARSGVPSLIALKGLLGATVAATDIYFTQYLQRELGYTPTVAGLIVAIGALGWVTGSWIQGRRSDDDRTHHGRLGPASGLVVAGPLSLLCVISGLAHVSFAVAGCTVMGVGMGMAYPRITSAAITQTEPRRHGSISSALQAVEQLGTSTLLAVTGMVLTTTVDNYLMTYAIVTIVGCLAFGVAIRPKARLKPMSGAC